MVRKLTNFYCNFLIFSIRSFVFSLEYFTVVAFNEIKISTNNACIILPCHTIFICHKHNTM